ncbi:MAG: 4-phosphoerythronate dehydrogenase [Mariprofundaceae bacterium]|nr:4-phosphoerythronate dehydrogenase [Mariprofundaceae bacterium]
MTANTLNIVADEHIWGVQEACSYLSPYNVQLCILQAKDITAEALKSANILLTRSSTQVDASLLAGSKVRFAGTATIGDDHYDKTWLDANQIAWATAAGSSTDSVLEYILAALLELHEQRKLDLSSMTLGVIGAGRIGGQLVNICRALGIKVLVNDPPRQRLTQGDNFVALQELLNQADVLTLHTPLIKNGSDKTYHLLADAQFQEFQGSVIINAARGACVDNLALLHWLNSQRDNAAVLDCWENEPAIFTKLLHHKQCMIATPHIAGHSLDGKAANTQYIYNALCDYLGIEAVWNAQDELPKLSYHDDDRIESWYDLHEKIEQFYPLMQDHLNLIKGEGCIADRFVYLRRHYPVRRAWKKQSKALSQILHANAHTRLHIGSF